MKASYWEGVMVVASTATTLNNLREERLTEILTFFRW
jgi:hypothetical protein